MTAATTKKKAGGRPLAATKKETVVRVRFDKGQYFVLRHKAQKAGLNFSTYLRQAAENAPIKAALLRKKEILSANLWVWQIT